MPGTGTPSLTGATTKRAETGPRADERPRMASPESRVALTHVDEGDGIDKAPPRSSFGRPAAPAALGRPPGPGLARTTIDVHGHALVVEYDARAVGPGDIEAVADGMRKYPPRWVNAAVDRARSQGEPALKIVIAGQAQIGARMKNPPRTDAFYSPRHKAIYFNTDRLNAPDRKLADDAPTSRRGQLEWLAAHELAHYFDDVGQPDASPDTLYPYATDADLEAFETSAFEIKVKRRNASKRRSDYFSTYDQRSNMGRDAGRFAREQETFAEIARLWVNSDAQQRAALLEHPTKGPMVRQVINYLDRGMDPTAFDEP